MALTTRSKQILIIIGSAILILIFIFLMPAGLSEDERNMYMINIISLVCILIIFQYVYFKYPTDIFDPYVLTTAIYLMIFSITPMLDIINHKVVIFGFDPASGAVKATIIFILSYIAFCCGYLWKKEYCYFEYQSFDLKVLYVSTELRICRYAYLFWIIGVIGTLIYLLNNGLSLQYIMTLGAGAADDVVENSGTALDFIGMLSFTMITATIYILLFEKNILLKSIVYSISVALLLIRGFRSILIIILFAPIICHYVSKKKRPSILAIILIVIFAILMIGFVGYIRNGLRHGEGINTAGIDMNVFVDSILENFSRYNVFYGMVEALPLEHSYTLGKNYFYTLVMIIPRLLWPGKPQPVMYEVLEVSTNTIIAESGAAWPNIGEYYMEFGVTGCIVFMYLLGRIFSRLRKYFNSKETTIHSLIGYSVFVPSLITIIAYGYTPSTAYMLLFLLIPPLFMKYVQCY